MSHTYIVHVIHRDLLRNSRTSGRRSGWVRKWAGIQKYKGAEQGLVFCFVFQRFSTEEKLMRKSTKLSEGDLKEGISTVASQYGVDFKPSRKLFTVY